MRLHVPPRDIASLVILRAITRAGWATAAVLLLFTGVMVVDVMASHGVASASIAPLGFLTAQFAALVLLSLRPQARTGVIFLIVSVACIAGYQLALFSADPTIDDASRFVVNRPIVALCAIGAVTGGPIGGIRWSTAGLLAGELTSYVVQVSLGRNVELGLGPLVAYLLIVLLMLWVRRSSFNQRERMPDPTSVDAETRRLEEERDAEARAAAVVHDTVLSDLAAIVHGRVVLSEYDRQHLRNNVGRLRAAMAGELEVTDSGSVDLDLIRVISDLQWRGLSVELSGSGSALGQLSRPARTAALNAIRAALENVLVHAGTTSVDLFIDETPDDVMVMIVDQGAGFDPEAVGSDRLGLRLSIVKRIEDCGGRATVWSRPGVGTSVVLSLPKANGGAHAT